jgi:hypothetical protein
MGYMLWCNANYSGTNHGKRLSPAALLAINSHLTNQAITLIISFEYIYMFGAPFPDPVTLRLRTILLPAVEKWMS